MKLKHVRLLSNSAFNCELRHYTKVLTAADCVENDRRYVVHLGRHDLSGDEGGAEAIPQDGAAVQHPVGSFGCWRLYEPGYSRLPPSA